MVGIGAYGLQSDGGVLRKSAFGAKLNNNTLNIPPDKCLPNCSELFPNFFIGDDALPFQPNLMKPYSGRYVAYQ